MFRNIVLALIMLSLIEIHVRIFGIYANRWWNRALFVAIVGVAWLVLPDLVIS